MIGASADASSMANWKSKAKTKPDRSSFIIFFSLPAQSARDRPIITTRASARIVEFITGGRRLRRLPDRTPRLKVQRGLNQVTASGQSNELQAPAPISLR